MKMFFKIFISFFIIAFINNPLTVSAPFISFTEITGDAEINQHEPRHAIINISREIFDFSVENPRNYAIDGIIAAGVIPHHTTAAVMISGFFSSLSSDYDTVIILAPNHGNTFAKIISSDRDWESDVLTHENFVADLIADNEIAEISHSRMEEDHSASVFIPYIAHYLPNATVAPVLLSRALSFDEVMDFSAWLINWINHSEENILVLASIDFSHYLTAREAAGNDRVTINAVMERDYYTLYRMNSDFLDSSAVMIVFLRYLESLCIEPQIIDNANSQDFISMRVEETTSYIIIAG